MKKLLSFAAVAAAVFFPAIDLPAAVQPDALFQDHYVFCAGKPTDFTGTATPGEKITIAVQGKTYAGTADEKGRYRVTVAAQPVIKTPFSVTISGKDSSVEMKNVLSGLVFIAGGQSNMEVRIKETLNAKEEIRNANTPSIREFKVVNNFEFDPVENLSGKWTPVTPETAANTGAVSYYCARVIQKEMDGIPIGIINNSWGATSQQAWLPMEVAAKIRPAYRDELEKFRPMGKEGIFKRRDELAKQMVLQPPAQDMKLTADWHKPDFDDSDWKTIKLPATLETIYGHKDGVYWFRKTIELPETKEDLTLSLNVVDDMDITWFNGVEIGRTEVKNGWEVPRNYTIPARLIKPGKNVIAVRCFDSGHAGGIFHRDIMIRRAPKDMVLNLETEWKIKDEKIMESLPWPPGYYELVRFKCKASVLYNAMFYPLRGLPVTAYLWYQGENNSGQGHYKQMLAEHVKIIRRDLKNDQLPILIAQLAAYRAPAADPNKTGEWPITRAHQAEVAAEAENVWIAPCIDIGDAKNIHPLNKQELGRRFALTLLQNVFKIKGFENVIHYPEITSAVADTANNTVTVTLKNAQGLKTTDGKTPYAFAIAGSEKKYNGKYDKGKYVYVRATAKIEGEKIILTVPEGVKGKPAMLRYAYSMNPEVNTVNGLGFPLLPLQTEIK